MQPLILLVAVSQLTPLDLIKHYLAVKEGLISGDCLIKLTARLSQGSNHSTAIANLRPNVEQIKPLKRRWYTWCRSSPARHKLKGWMVNYLIHHDPNSLFKVWSDFLDQKLKEEIDPWKVDDWEKDLPPITPNTDKKLTFKGTRTLKLPIVEKLEEEGGKNNSATGNTIRFEEVMGRKEKIDACRTVLLKEEAVLELRDQHLVLMIGGPKNSGKSSLAASLSVRMGDILTDLGSRGIEGLPTLKLFSADTATPVSDLITPEGRLPDELTRRRKKPWSPELVTETVNRLIGERQKTNLIIADLPGKIDHITSSLVSIADAGCVISQNWQDHVGEIHETRKMFKRAGLPILIQASSRSFEEGYPSVLKTYFDTIPDKRYGFISGRVVGLNRADWSWDAFVYWAAELLLFELLPGLIARQKIQLEQHTH